MAFPDTPLVAATQWGTTGALEINRAKITLEVTANLNLLAARLLTHEAAPTTYAATMTGGGTFSMGNSTITGRQLQLGQMMDWWVDIVIGSTFNAGTGSFVISLPAAAGGRIAGDYVGSGHINHASTAKGVNCYLLAGLATINLFRQSNETVISNTGPGSAFVTGNLFSLQGRYPLS